MSIEQWVIYQRPADQPDDPFVVRCWTVTGNGPVALPGTWGRETLTEARAIIDRLAPGRYRLDRAPEDDPAIVEVWT